MPRRRHGGQGIFNIVLTVMSPMDIKMRLTSTVQTKA